MDPFEYRRFFILLRMGTFSNIYDVHCLLYIHVSENKFKSIKPTPLKTDTAMRWRWTQRTAPHRNWTCRTKQVIRSTNVRIGLLCLRPKNSWCIHVSYNDNNNNSHDMIMEWWFDRCTQACSFEYQNLFILFLHKWFNALFDTVKLYLQRNDMNDGNKRWRYKLTLKIPLFYLSLHSMPNCPNWCNLVTYEEIIIKLESIQ